MTYDEYIIRSRELYHYGVKGMKWGVRRTPEQLGHRSSKGSGTASEYSMHKSSHQYQIRDKKGRVLSKLSYWDYNIDGFDWVLVADVDTRPSHQGKGLGTKLMQEVYSDVTRKEPDKGIYVFARQDNNRAIGFYKNLGYKTVKPYSLDDGEYYIMAKGKADTRQFDEIDFR